MKWAPFDLIREKGQVGCAPNSYPTLSQAFCLPDISYRRTRCESYNRAGCEPGPKLDFLTVAQRLCSTLSSSINLV